MLSARGWVGHDRCGVLGPVADIAVRVQNALVVFVLKVAVPLIAIIGPGNRPFAKNVADVAQSRRRDRENGVARIRVGIGVAAVAEVARIVVVEKIVMPFLAVGIDLTLERIEVIQHGPDAGLARVGAIAVGSAAVISVGRDSGGRS